MSGGRNTWTNGPIPKAKTAVPTPIAPPSATPIAKAATSTDVRATRIEIGRPASLTRILQPGSGLLVV